MSRFVTHIASSVAIVNPVGERFRALGTHLVAGETTNSSLAARHVR
jgi:hypothetical protein